MRDETKRVAILADLAAATRAVRGERPVEARDAAQVALRRIERWAEDSHDAPGRVKREG